MTRAWTSSLPADRHAPAAARAFVEDSLRRVVGPDLSPVAETCEDLTVIVSELVTNAVQAATSTVSVELAVESGSVRLAVTDVARGMPTLAGPASATQPYGRGLAIVAALSRDWGVVPLAGDGAGKTVWARLDLPL